MSKKPIFNYMKLDGTFITHRESLKEFAPTEDEFTKLKGKIIKIIDQETTSEFDDKIDYLITFLREQAYRNVIRTPNTVAQKELLSLINKMKSLSELMDNGISDLTEQQINYTIMSKPFDEDHHNALYRVSKDLKIGIDICKEAKKNYKGSKAKFTPNTMREILAEELARELEKIGVEPTKYKNGKFGRCLKAILNMIPATVYNKNISIYTPDNLFPIICRAIDKYPHKEPYSLLDFD